MPSLFTLFLFVLLLTCSFSIPTATTIQPSPSSSSLPLPSDAVSLLSFKSSADLDNKLLYDLNERFDYCEWQGVKCIQGRVVRFVLQGFGLRGFFPPNTLSRLDQLRALSLRNNSLTGPIPDLSSLLNLKSLFLDRNHFSGSFPISILQLHRLLTLHLSHNNLTGPIPLELTVLDRLASLRLEFNRFNGTVPPLNQSSLLVFNVSWNNLTGAIPVTPTLARFDTSSFSWNPALCGEVIHKACDSRFPFFGSPNPNGNGTSSVAPLGQSAQSQGINLVNYSPNGKKHSSMNMGFLLGFTIGVAVLIAITLAVCGLALLRKQSNQKLGQESRAVASVESRNDVCSPPSMVTHNSELQAEAQAKAKKIEELQRVHKSGNLVFCSREAQLYTIEQLMRASAELLGRGTSGTTYKAVLDNGLIVTVKRLDAGKSGVRSSKVSELELERHMEMVGGLRHPNLVPVRAYFEAKGERLVIYDYQPNGSLFNLIHGESNYFLSHLSLIFTVH